MRRADRRCDRFRLRKPRHCARFHIPGGFTRDFRLNLPDAAAADVRGAEAELTRRKSIKTRHTEAVAKLCADYIGLFRSTTSVSRLAQKSRDQTGKPGSIASARLVELKKGGGGTERCLFGSSRLFAPCDFSLQGRDALIDFLHGKVVETLSDLVRRRRLSWRRAENLIVISSHANHLVLPRKPGIPSIVSPLIGTEPCATLAATWPLPIPRQSAVSRHRGRGPDSLPSPSRASSSREGRTRGAACAVERKCRQARCRQLSGAFRKNICSSQAFLRLTQCGHSHARIGTRNWTFGQADNQP